MVPGPVRDREVPMRHWMLALAAAAILAPGSRGVAVDDEEKPAGEGKPKAEEPKEDVLAKVAKLGKRFRFKFTGTHTMVRKTDKGDEKGTSEQTREWWPGAWFDRKEDLKWEKGAFTASWDGGTDAWREVVKVEGRMSADGKSVESLMVEYRKDWKETKGWIKVAFEVRGVGLRFAGESTVRFSAEGAEAKKAVVKYEEAEDYGSAGGEDMRANTYLSTDWEKSASVVLVFGDQPD